MRANRLFSIEPIIDASAASKWGKFEVFTLTADEEKGSIFLKYQYVVFLRFLI